MRKLNHGFVCRGCGVEVLPARLTSRNHCPYCFISSHVDGEIPGDRKSSCGGVMIPIQYFIKHSKQKIEFCCVECGKRHINKVAPDDNLGNLDMCIQDYKKKYLKYFTKNNGCT